MVLGDKEHVIYGKGYIEDELCGKRFRISPKSFYQVNPVQTEILYGKALEYAGLTGKETVVDAYCGTGTIGMIASALVYSISETAKLNNLRPYYYFRHILTELPKYCDEKGNIDPAKLDHLMPWAEELPEECRKPRRS